MKYVNVGNLADSEGQFKKKDMEKFKSSKSDITAGIQATSHNVIKEQAVT